MAMMPDRVLPQAILIIISFPLLAIASQRHISMHKIFENLRQPPKLLLKTL